MNTATSAQTAPRSAMVPCAVCPAMVPEPEAIVSEAIDPESHRWYTFHLCQGCADPADLLLDRLIREDAARRVAG